jgi:hypothetical protein
MLRYLMTTHGGRLLHLRQTAYQQKGLWFRLDESSGAGHSGASFSSNKIRANVLFPIAALWLGF